MLLFVLEPPHNEYAPGWLSGVIILWWSIGTPLKPSLFFRLLFFAPECLVLLLYQGVILY